MASATTYPESVGWGENADRLGSGARKRALQRQRHCATCQCMDERGSASKRQKNWPSIEGALVPPRQGPEARPPNADPSVHAVQSKQAGIESPSRSSGVQHAESENGSFHVDEYVDDGREDRRHDTMSASHNEIDQTDIDQRAHSSRRADSAVDLFATKTGLPVGVERMEEECSVYSADSRSLCAAAESIIQPGWGDSQKCNIDSHGDADSGGCRRNGNPVSERADTLNSNDSPAPMQTGAGVQAGTTAAEPLSPFTLSDRMREGTSQETVSNATEALGNISTDDPERSCPYPSSGCSRPCSDMKHWLITEAQARGMPPFSVDAVKTWIKYASLATVDGVVQNIQSWIRLARQHQTASKGEARRQLELIDLLPARATSVHDQTLALAARTFRNCEHATVIGGQASLCRRLCYANLYRLNEQARAQNAQGWGFRNIVFGLCYPEFASGGNLRSLDGAARTALNRLTGNIHFGGAICRFVDLGPCAEAIVLLHPDIPNRFLQRLTAAQMGLWADLVYRLGMPTSACLQDLWKTTAMIINHNIDLQTYRFPLEQVCFNGVCYVDVETQQPFEGPLSQLLTPVSVDGLWLLHLQTNAVMPTSNAAVAPQRRIDSPSSLTESTRFSDVPLGQNMDEELHGTTAVNGPATARSTHSTWDENDEFEWALDLSAFGKDGTA